VSRIFRHTAVTGGRVKTKTATRANNPHISAEKKSASGFDGYGDVEKAEEENFVQHDRKDSAGRPFAPMFRLESFEVSKASKLFPRRTLR
jgi:hypothetical protein